MKGILITLIILSGSVKSNCQQERQYEFILYGLIGITEIVPLQGVLIKLNDTIVNTNKYGEFNFKSSDSIVRIKINHLGFSDLDTFYQSHNLKPKTEIHIIADCWVNKELAISDIEKNDIKLYLTGGIAPVIINGQKKVEQLYDFKYHDFGCVAPPNECIKQYNLEIFKYFDFKYGSKWKRKIRNDVIGIKEYKK